MFHTLHLLRKMCCKSIDFEETLICIRLLNNVHNINYEASQKNIDKRNVITIKCVLKWNIKHLFLDIPLTFYWHYPTSLNISQHYPTFLNNFHHLFNITQCPWHPLAFFKCLPTTKRNKNRIQFFFNFFS